MNFLLYSLMWCFAVFQNSYTPNPIPRPRHQFMVIAHRGDHVNYPENTLAAYRQAIKDEADYIEIDLRTTKDGRLISLHNESVDRMTNGSGLVKDLTFNAIKKLNIKAVDSSRNVRYSIPAFEEILKLCKNKIYIYIDFKDADPAVVFAMLKRFGMENQVLVYINKPGQLTAWRSAAPNMPLMLSLPGNVKDSLALRQFIDQYKPDVLDGNFTEYNNELVAFAKGHHIPVWPDGQSSSEGAQVWDAAIAKGLTGLQTDHPGAFISYLTKKGLR